MEQVTEIAKTMRPRSMARKLAGTVKEILGTCQSVGCTVEGQNPHDVIDKISDGEIEIEVSAEQVSFTTAKNDDELPVLAPMTGCYLWSKPSQILVGTLEYRTTKL